MKYIVNKLNLALCVAGPSILLAACGGGGSDTTQVTQPVVTVNMARVSLTPLKPASSSLFSNQLKNGIYGASVGSAIDCADCQIVVTTPSNPASSEASQTNTQEAGVDEADRIEYDGEYLYIAAHSHYEPIAADELPSGSTPDYIKILHRQEDSSMQEVTQLPLPDGFIGISGLYLQDNILTALSGNFYWASALTVEPFGFFDQQLQVAFYNVESPENSQLTHSLAIDGYLLSSRRIDNRLYLVSSFTPSVEGLVFGDLTDDQKRANYSKVLATDISQLMPKMHLSTAGGSVITQNLVSPEDCFIPQDAGASDGYNNIVTITAIDLTAPSQHHSLCVNGAAQDIYASREGIYLLGTSFGTSEQQQSAQQQSVIHKFSLTDQPSYVGTANVDGHLGWHNAAFRLSEYQGKLRVVSTENTNDGPRHRLSIFAGQAEQSQLPLLSHLPNDEHPEPIGKPNEDIYAVRYFNEKAYVVTFERQDPLYVLDLADATAPKMAGQLEMPGYSSYLHPISQNLILGIGQQLDPNNLPGAGEAGGLANDPIEEGAKIALFDVSNPASPQVVGELVYPNGVTPVEWDHHALTYLPVSDSEFRFALPLNVWQQSQDTWTADDSLLMLSVTVENGVANLVERNRLQPQIPTTDQYYYIGNSDDRSVLQGDDVYFVHGNAVTHGLW